MKIYNRTILENPRLRNFIDYTKFQENHVLYNKNNQECGKIKFERKGKIINYAISLRSKMYYLYTIDKKIKGITYAVKDNMITNEHFFDAILGQTFYVRNQTRIQCKDDQLYTLQEQKKALNSDDTKRYITENPMITRALRHINNQITNLQDD